MVRPPDPKSKIVRVFLTAKPGEEPKVRAFKEICARNGIKVRTVLMEKVDSFLREHNYPPGNSQTLIKGYLEPQKKGLRKCKKLKRQKEAWANYIGWCKTEGRWVTEENCRNCPLKSTG